MKHRINNICNRALKLVYQDFHDLKFEGWLAKAKSVSVLLKNLQLLGTEIFRFEIGVTPELKNDIFHFVKTPFFKKQLCIRKKRDHTPTKLNKKFCFSQGIQNKN